ncbi:MAG TPA: hypothetical protein ENO08_07645, partial [Candidatus Eisenbacteria bacterium]|nr:hypothetical protein [Candidatus Eisenbacteria bacterium]
MNKAVFILLVLAAVTAAQPAGAQEADSTAAAAADSTGKVSAPSSLLAAKVAQGGSSPDSSKTDAEAGRWLIPQWTGRYRASESEYRLGSGMGLTFEPGAGWHGSSTIDIARRDYRGRDMSDINERFNNTAIRIVPGLYNINFGLGQDYLRQKAIGLARSGGDMVIENKFFNTGATWERAEFWAEKSRFALLGRAGGGQNDFKYDKNLQANASGYLWYGIGSRINVSGGYGVWRKVEDSDVSGRQFDNMPSKMDTVSAKVGVGSGEKKLLFIDYKRTAGVIRKVDPPRGNSLEVIENPDLAIMERSTRAEEKLTARSKMQPMSFLSLDLEYVREYFNQQNLVDDRLSKETEKQDIKAKVGYRYAGSGFADFEITKSDDDVDYGPVSLSSYTQSENSIKASVKQDISDSVRVVLRGSGSLKQQFYKKKDANPRDADYLYYSLLADLDAGLPLNIRAGVKFIYKYNERINIDASLSNDNNTEFTYWVVPRFTLRPALWFEIGQEYEIKMEYTEFTFKENENYLDRTTIMNTNAKFKFYRSHLAINHRYQFIDTGSYLAPPEGGERLYGRTNESYEHRMSFRYEYMPTTEFAIYTFSNYRFQQSNRLGAIDGEMGILSTRYYDSGEMTLGLKRVTK